MIRICYSVTMKTACERSAHVTMTKVVVSGDLDNDNSLNPSLAGAHEGNYVCLPWRRDAVKSTTIMLGIRESSAINVGKHMTLMKEEVKYDRTTRSSSARGTGDLFEIVGQSPFDVMLSRKLLESEWCGFSSLIKILKRIAVRRMVLHFKTSWFSYPENSESTSTITRPFTLIKKHHLRPFQHQINWYFKLLNEAFCNWEALVVIHAQYSLSQYKTWIIFETGDDIVVDRSPPCIWSFLHYRDNYTSFKSFPKTVVTLLKFIRKHVDSRVCASLIYSWKFRYVATIHRFQGASSWNSNYFLNLYRRMSRTVWKSGNHDCIDRLRSKKKTTVNRLWVHALLHLIRLRCHNSPRKSS